MGSLTRKSVWYRPKKHLHIHPYTCSCFVQVTTLPGRTAVNAMLPKPAPATQATDRTERLLAMLQRLAEIGMQLAERAAGQAFAEPPPRPDSAPRSRRQGPDPRYVFIRLSRFVRETIALEARLAAGIIPRSARKASVTHPGTQTLRQGINDVAKTSPHPRPAETGLRQQLDAFISGSLTAGPAAMPAPSRKVGLACDTARIHANILNQPFHLVSEMERIATEALAAHRARLCTTPASAR